MIGSQTIKLISSTAHAVLLILLVSCDDQPLPEPTAANTISGVVDVAFWNEPFIEGSAHWKDEPFDVGLSFLDWKNPTTATIHFENSDYPPLELAFDDINLDKPVIWLDAQPTNEQNQMSLRDGVGNIRRTTLATTFNNDTVSLPSSRFGHQVVVMTDSKTSLPSFFLIGGSDKNLLYNDCWKSFDGINWIPLTFNAAFSPRQLHRVVVMNDPLNQNKSTMWLIGGAGGDSKELNDIYKSIDGVKWDKVAVSGTPFPARYSFSMVTMKDPVTGAPTLFVIGGRNLAGTRLNDIWKSANGADWIKVTTSGTIFPPRSSHQCAIANDPTSGKSAIWLTGGTDGTNALADVWKSTDGVAWTRTTASAAFGGRIQHQLVSWNSGSGEKLYLIAGSGGVSIYDDVWTSTDGISWTVLNNASDSPRFQYRYLHQAVVGDFGTGSTLWIFGGQKWTGKAFSDVWKTTDGVNFKHGVGASLVF